jgi:hypothetical protein
MTQAMRPVVRAVRELKALAKVDLDPGETTMVELALTARNLFYWSTRLNDWALEGDEFGLAIIGDFPISTIAGFPGFYLSHAAINSLLDQLPASNG